MASCVGGMAHKRSDVTIVTITLLHYCAFTANSSRMIRHLLLVCIQFLLLCEVSSIITSTDFILVSFFNYSIFKLKNTVWNYSCIITVILTVGIINKFVVILVPFQKPVMLPVRQCSPSVYELVTLITLTILVRGQIILEIQEYLVEEII